MKAHSPDELRHRESEFRQVTSRRNTLEYLAGGTGALLFLVMGALTLLRAELVADFVLAGGFIALAAGLLIPIWRLFRADRSAGGHPATPDHHHLQSRLKRERKLLSSAWLWYVVPMVPGFVLFHLGYWLSNQNNLTFPFASGGLALILLIYVAIANRHAARKLDRVIKDVDVCRQVPR